MADLKEQIQYALDEGRILVLGTQVLVGFQFSAVFQTAFETLPVSSQYANTIALGLVLFTLILLVWPATYTRLSSAARTRWP